MIFTLLDILELCCLCCVKSFCFGLVLGVCFVWGFLLFCFGFVCFGFFFLCKSQKVLKENSLKLNFSGFDIQYAFLLEMTNL